MAIQFVGVSDFTLQSITRGEPHFGLRTRHYEYRGAYTKTEEFLSDHETSTELVPGGYIVQREVDEGGAYDRVVLIVAFLPNLAFYTRDNSKSIKTASKSVEIENADIHESIAGPYTPDNPEPEEPIINATRDVTYYSPETRYRYFASSQPTSPRFTGVAVGTASGLRRIRDRIVAETAGKSSRTKNYGSSAPAALVSALTMPVQSQLVTTDSSQIPGTPWYDCTDIFALEYVPD